VADPNRALFESVVRILAPVLDELVFVAPALPRGKAASRSAGV